MGSIGWKRAGIVVGALMALGISLRTFLAISRNEPFIGSNYWGAPIGTYLMLPVLVIGIPVGLWWSIRNWRK
jgi:hypothetical protein